MKTDEQYVMEFETLFVKHHTWNTQRVMNMFKAEHGSLNEDDVLRLFNKWITKNEIPSPVNAKTVSRHLGAFKVFRSAEKLHDIEILKNGSVVFPDRRADASKIEADFSALRGDDR
jgi:hypothetical protein